MPSQSVLGSVCSFQIKAIKQSGTFELLLDFKAFGKHLTMGKLIVPTGTHVLTIIKHSLVAPIWVNGKNV